VACPRSIQIGVIAKKIRGQEGWLAPALPQRANSEGLGFDNITGKPLSELARCGRAGASHPSLPLLFFGMNSLQADLN
jgi:hypothetical protein